MTSPDPSSSESRYYDAEEVEAYIQQAEATFAELSGQLQTALARAEAAEGQIGGVSRDRSSLGRALVLASEVADNTIAEADQQAARIRGEAEGHARQTMERAREEAARLTAGNNARADREAAILAALARFDEQCQALQQDLDAVQREVTALTESRLFGSPSLPPAEPAPPAGEPAPPPAANTPTPRDASPWPHGAGAGVAP